MVKLARTDITQRPAREAEVSRVANRWMVLRTKSRQEKAVARYISLMDCEYYLPLIERVNYIRGKRFTSKVPVFPGYVFLTGQMEDAYETINTKRVCQVIPITDQDRFVHEISQVRQALEGNAPLELYPFAVVGKRCRVARGPFMGLEGVIVERLKQARLILNVDILGRGVALEIDLDMLEPLD